MRIVVASVFILGAAILSSLPASSVHAAEHGLADAGRCMQGTIVSSVIYHCYDQQLAALDKRLPSGSAEWKKKMEAKCHSAYPDENDMNTMSVYECEVKATAIKVHAS